LPGRTREHDSLRCQKYWDCVDAWRQAIHTDELLAEECVVNANNVNAFYKYVVKRTTNHTGIGIVVDNNGLPITNGQIKANAFNTYFSSVIVADNNITPVMRDITLLSVLNSIVISETNVLQSIRSNTRGRRPSTPKQKILFALHASPSTNGRSPGRTLESARTPPLRPN